MPDATDWDASPISDNQMHEVLKELTGEDTNCKKRASKYLASQMRLSIKQLIQRADEIRAERNDAQLEYEHMEQAVDEAFAPYHLMNNFLDIMDDYEYKLKKEAESTQILDFSEIEDE